MQTKTVRSALLCPSILAILILCASCGGGNMTATMRNQLCSGCLFVYSTTNSGEIFTFPVSRMNGSLGVPSSVAGPANSGGILTLSPANSAETFLYVSDPQINAVRVYKVSSVDGTLSATSIGPYSLGNSIGTPGQIVPFGSALYVAGSGGSIAAFAVNEDGSLSTVPGSPFAAGAGLSHLAAVSLGSSASFLYAANTSDANGSISAFSIGANGALTPVPGSPFATVPGGGPAGFFGGNPLYVALKNANAVAGFATNSDGSLVPIAGSPFVAGRGTFSLNGAGSFLFATNNIEGTISSYSIDFSTGALTEVTGSPFPGAVSSGDAVYADTAILFIPDATSNTIHAFMASTDTGMVGPVAGSPFQVGASPLSLNIGGFPHVDPPGAN